MMETAQMASKSSRKSNIELLRLFAMFLIIYYHLFEWLSASGTEAFPRAIWIPIHIGVPVFVLISGYFGIRFSWKGFAKLVLSMGIYTIAIQALEGGLNFYDLFFISRTPYWFMSIYMMLYVLSPFINKGLNTLSNREEIYLILVLAVISLYIGGIHTNPVYNNGKNILNFTLIYSIGDLIRRNEQMLNNISIWWIISMIVFIPLVEVTSYLSIHNEHIRSFIWQESFPYNSPGLIINGSLFFLLFSRMKFQSSIINWLAKSCLAVYLIHAHPALNPIFLNISNLILQNNCQVFTALIFLIYALLLLLLCVLIDKIVEILINALVKRI